MKPINLRRIGWGLLVGLCCLAALAAPVLAGKSAEAERYDVDLTLGSDGAVLVNETVTFRYAGGPFTFVKREIPTHLTDGIQFLQAGMDGRPLPLGSSAGQVEVDNDSPLLVTWHFEGVSDSSHSFSLGYKALGVTQKQSGADVFVFTALPREHDYPIHASTVRVHYPAGAQLTGTPAATNGNATVESGSGLVTFRAAELGANKTLEVRLEFAPGSLTIAAPAWQARAAAQAERNQRSMPLFLAFGAVLTLVGGAGVWVFRRSVQPESLPGMESRGPSPLKPSELAPALAGTLLNGGAMAQNGLLAVLFELARRGAVAIEEQPKTGWLAGKDFLVRLLNLDGLKPYEWALLETLFKSSALSAGMSVSLQKNGPQLAQHWSTISNAINQELLKGGWVDVQRQKTARTWSWAAGTTFLLSFAILIGAVLLIEPLGAWVLLPAFVLMLVGLAWLIAATTLTRLSDRGRVESAGWKAFRDYLNQVAHGREPATRPDLFEAYLPYAAAFGLAQAWANFFQKKGILQIPTWFRTTQTGSGYEMVAFMSMIHSSTAATSAGSASGGASAGGGSSSTG